MQTQAKSASQTRSKRPRQDVREAELGHDGPERIGDLQSQFGNRTIGALSASGAPGDTPLPDGFRQEMESRFGTDFGAVRVSTEPSLDARAVTEGERIRLGPGEGDVTTRSGRRLMAHELAHVVQQRRGGSEHPTTDGTGPLEVAANRAADAALSHSGPVEVAGASAIGPAAQLSLQDLWNAGALAFEAARADPVGTLDRAREEFVPDFIDDMLPESEVVVEEISDELANARARVEAPTPPEQFADAVSTHAWAVGQDLGPQVGAARAYSDAANVLSEGVETFVEPVREGSREALQGDLLGAVGAWQAGMDARLPALNETVRAAVRAHEDDDYGMLGDESNRSNNLSAQVFGGFGLSAYEAAMGLVGMGVHPVDTAVGLYDAVATIGGGPRSADYANMLELYRHLADENVSAAQKASLIEKLNWRPPDQELLNEQRGRLLVRMFEPIIDSAGGRVNPDKGTVDWEGWEERSRPGELVGRGLFALADGRESRTLRP